MKNCHLSSYNRVATLVLAAFITFVPSTGWAGIIEGNLTVEKNPSADPSDGNLTIEGTSTLKGNINLGDDTSDTTTFKGKVVADGNLTVNGALKIQSVDGAGVINDIGATYNNNTIPTTRAVEKYVTSKRNNNNVRIYNSDQYTLTFASSLSDDTTFYILSGADAQAVPVDRQLGVNGTVMFVLRVNGLGSHDNDNEQDRFTKSTLIALDDECRTLPRGYNVEHSFLDVNNSFFNVWGFVNDLSAQIHTVYFCLKVTRYRESVHKTPVFDFAHISIH